MLEVKGWLIIGPKLDNLINSQPPLKFIGAPADASSFPQGTVAECAMYSGTLAPHVFTLVCVRIPIMPGME
jgi:hypothetical protein